MSPYSSRRPLPVHRGQQCNVWRHGASPELWVFPRGSSMPALLVPHVRLSRYHGPPCVPAPGQTGRGSLVEKKRPRRRMERGYGRAHGNWDFPGTTTSAGLSIDPILLSLTERTGCMITLRSKQLFLTTDHLRRAQRFQWSVWCGNRRCEALSWSMLW